MTEKQREARKRYEKNHPEAQRESRKRYRKNHPEVERKARKKYRETHRAQLSARDRKRKYGIAHAEFEKMMDDQGRTCSICQGDRWGKLGPKVDHDHATGSVRGILCQKCNAGLGFFNDNAGLIKRAADYLIRSPKKSNATAR